MSEVRIPDKLALKRKEVIQLSKLDGKVLDYWEKEFALFAPLQNQNGEKFYTRQDVEIILKLKQLLIVEKVDKRKVKEMFDPIPAPRATSDRASALPQPVNKEKLKKIRGGLREILTLLDKNGK